MASVSTGLLQERIPYISGGAGPRQVLVLFGANALFKPLNKVSNPARYAAQVERLLPSDCRYTIIGYQETPSGPPTVGTIADDLAEVLSQLTAESVPVVGISFGGFVALRLAANYPELVRCLVMLVSAHRFSEAGWHRMERKFRALEAEDFEQLVKDNALLFRRPWYNWLVQLKLLRANGHLGAEFKDAGVILSSYRSIFSGDFARNAEAAMRVVAPTLILGGSHDQYFDAACFSETTRLIPRARLKLFAGETHMLPIERSREAASEITAFLHAER